MFLRVAILFVPFMALAQTPQDKAEEVLRTRVTEFLQDHVDGNFRKAFDYVADDTKDYYFGAPKTQYKSFHIDKIDFLDNNKAAVHATVNRDWTFHGQTMPATSSVVLIWVLDGGKWCWHYAPGSDLATPMGKSAPQTIKPNPDGTPAPPPLSPEAIAAKAREILGHSGIDKTEVVLGTSRASSDQVKFHNGYPGSVRVVLDPGPEVAGFRVQLDKADLRSGEDAVVKLNYAPASPTPRSPVNVRLTIEPFNQVFNVAVKFEGPAQ
jgi:hypothetical protein